MTWPRLWRARVRFWRWAVMYASRQLSALTRPAGDVKILPQLISDTALRATVDSFHLHGSKTTTLVVFAFVRSGRGELVSAAATCSEAALRSRLNSWLRQTAERPLREFASIPTMGGVH